VGTDRQHSLFWHREISPGGQVITRFLVFPSSYGLPCSIFFG
jgi:hypothetical protein